MKQVSTSSYRIRTDGEGQVLLTLTSRADRVEVTLSLEPDRARSLMLHLDDKIGRAVAEGRKAR